MSQLQQQQGNPWTPKPRDPGFEKRLFEGKTTEGINFDNYANIPINIAGLDVPPLITTFKDANLHPGIHWNLQLSGYNNPTPIQKASIPIVLERRDLMACAQTGSGKTAAFLLPILSNLFYDGPSSDDSENKGSSNRWGASRPVAATPSALILAPTRELAIQIKEEVDKFAYRSFVRCNCIYGGTSVDQQRNSLSNGCDVLVATPGRLMDFLERGVVYLRNVRYLIMDEADRMLDMGFEPQIRRIVEEADMPKERQVLLFSATFPTEIQLLANDYLNDFLFISIGRIGSTTENIKQEVIYVPQNRKLSTLVDIIKSDPNIKKPIPGEKPYLTLVFIRTKATANEVAKKLFEQTRIPVASIHGDIPQHDREASLAKFKKGYVPILVATDVAQRGLDIGGVEHVINYDLPEKIDDYVHRIGRTGRAGNTGRATSFYNESTNLSTTDLIKTLKEANQSIPSFLKPGGGGNYRGSRSTGGGNAPRTPANVYGAW